MQRGHHATHDVLLHKIRNMRIAVLRHLRAVAVSHHDLHCAIVGVKYGMGLCGSGWYRESDMTFQTSCKP